MRKVSKDAIGKEALVTSDVPYVFGELIPAGTKVEILRIHHLTCNGEIYYSGYDVRLPSGEVVGCVNPERLLPVELWVVTKPGGSQCENSNIDTKSNLQS